MNIFNKVTIKSMKKNPVRTLVTIIGIIISTAMFTAVTTLVSSLYSFVYRTQVYDTGKWHVGGVYSEYDEYASWLVDDRVEAVAAAKVLGYALCGSTNEYKPYIYVESVNDEFYELMPVHVTYGRQPEKSGELMLPDHLLENGNVKYNLGDTITLQLGKRCSADENGNVQMQYELSQNNPFSDEEKLVPERTIEYTVVGFYERPDFENYSAPGYTAITCGETMDDSGARYDYYVRLQNKYLHDVWIMDNYSENGSFDTYNSSIIAMEGSILYENVAAVFTVIAGIFVIIIVVASVSMIYSAFSISVGERTKQFGLLSSVGATRKQLRRMVFGEAFMVSFIGIPIGVICGIAGIGITLYFVGNKFNYLLASPYSVDLVINGYAILIAAVVALVTVLISAVIPAVRATHVSAIDAIRQHKDIRMRRTRWHAGRKYPVTKKLFGMPGILARRYFSRSRKKYRVTIFSLSISIILFIVTSSYCDYLKGYVSVNIEEQNYELRYMAHEEDEASLKKIKEVIQGSDGVMETSYMSWNYDYSIVCNDEELSDSYREYQKKLSELILERSEVTSGQSEVYHIGNDTYTVKEDILIVFMDDELYSENLKELKITGKNFEDLENAPGILKNTCSEVRFIYNSESGKYERYNLGYKFMREDIDSLNLSVYMEDKTIQLPVGAVVDDIPYSYIDNQLAVLVFPFSSKYNTGELNSGTQFFFVKQAGGKHEDMVDSITENLKREGLRTDDDFFYDPLKNINQQKNMLILINVFSYGFITLMALICIGNVFNTISTNVALRRRDFAMLRSVGLAYNGIKRMMIYECLLYGVRSIIFAAPVSIYLSYLIYEAYGGSGEFAFNFFIPWYAIVISVVGVFAVVGASMAYSVSKIREDNLIDELKEEND